MTAAGAGTRSRRQMLTDARAAGRRGEPAPGWADDSDLMAAFDEGLSESGELDDLSTLDETGGASFDDVSDPADELDGSTTPASSAPSKPAGGRGRSTSGGRGSGRSGRRGRSIGPVRPRGAAGDAAGAILGVIGAAFFVNVVKGTWADWLRAKFLNQVTTTRVLPGTDGAKVQTRPDGTQLLPDGTIIDPNGTVHPGKDSATAGTPGASPAPPPGPNAPNLGPVD